MCKVAETKKQTLTNSDGVVLEIYLDYKFQWPQEGLNCNSLAYKVVTYAIPEYPNKVANSGTPNPPNLLGLMA